MAEKVTRWSDFRDGVVFEAQPHQVKTKLFSSNDDHRSEFVAVTARVSITDTDGQKAVREGAASVQKRDHADPFAVAADEALHNALHQFTCVKFWQGVDEEIQPHRHPDPETRGHDGLLVESHLHDAEDEEDEE